MLSIMLILCLFGELTGKVQGIVTDQTTDQPIPYASVIILETESGTATDEEGVFFILNVLPNTYN